MKCPNEIPGWQMISLRVNGAVREIRADATRPGRAPLGAAQALGDETGEDPQARPPHARIAIEAGAEQRLHVLAPGAGQRADGAISARALLQLRHRVVDALGRERGRDPRDTALHREASLLGNHYEGR